MIQSNLAVLMAQRGLKISDLYEETGISKTTLMSISENTSKGIQYETVDKLCNFFGVSLSEFFIYSPFRFKVDYFNTDQNFFLDDERQQDPVLGDCSDQAIELEDIAVTLEKDGQKDSFPFRVTAVSKTNGRIPLPYQNKIDFGIIVENSDNVTQNGFQIGHQLNFVDDFMNSLDAQLKTKVINSINYAVLNNVKSVYKHGGSLELVKDPFDNDLPFYDFNSSEMNIYFEYSIPNYDKTLSVYQTALSPSKVIKIKI